MSNTWVQLIDNDVYGITAYSASVFGLTRGKNYGILDELDYSYILKDDFGIEHSYPKNWFKVINFSEKFEKVVNE